MPFPSDIVAEGFVRSSSNASSWGASTTLLGPDLQRTDSPIRPAIESTVPPVVWVVLCGGPMLTRGESCASLSITVLLLPLSKRSLHSTFATIVSSSLFPPPSDIVAKGSARSSSNACSWGASTTFFGPYLRTTDSPIHLAIESTARLAVCVGLCGGLELTTGENCAYSSDTMLLIPLLECPLRWKFDCLAFTAWTACPCKGAVHSNNEKSSSWAMQDLPIPPLHVQNVGHLIVQLSLQVVPTPLRVQCTPTMNNLQRGLSLLLQSILLKQSWMNRPMSL